MKITVRDIIRELQAEVLSGEDKLDVEVRRMGAADMMSDLLALAKPGMIVLTGYIYPQVIRSALVADLLGLILVRGKHIPQETIDMARANNLLLLRTSFYLYSSCGKMYGLGLRGGDEK